MRAGWEAIAAGLLLLLSTVLAPVAVASTGSGGSDGSDDGCTDIRYALTPELSGKVGTCHQPTEVPWDIWPEAPGGPGIPDYNATHKACGATTVPP